jgi:hypothetical protein
MRDRSARTSAVWVRKLRGERWQSRDRVCIDRLTDELTDGDLLGKRTLRAGPVLPAVGHAFAGPEELSVEETDGGDERGGQPPQAGTPGGIGVDADDRKEDGEPRGPYDCVKGHGHEVVRGNAVESREVSRMFHVHEHGDKLDEETGREGDNGQPCGAGSV